MRWLLFILLLPCLTMAGEDTLWVDGAGYTSDNWHDPGINNYQLVDEQNSHDGTTTEMKSDVNDEGEFEFFTLTSTAVDTDAGQTVDSVKVLYTIAKSTGLMTAEIIGMVRYDGTNAAAAKQAAGATSYNTYLSAKIGCPGGCTYTTAVLNAMECGVECETASSPGDLECTWVAVVVYYSEAAASEESQVIIISEAIE